MMTTYAMIMATAITQDTMEEGTGGEDTIDHTVDATTEEAFIIAEEDIEDMQ